MSRAEKTVVEGKVILVKAEGKPLFWVVYGEHFRNLYLVYGNCCTCTDFIMKVLRKKKDACYHVEAVKEALNKKIFRTINISNSNEINEIFNELLFSIFY